MGKAIDAPRDLEVRYLSDDRFRRNQRRHAFEKLETVMDSQLFLRSTIRQFCEESWPHSSFVM
jgi:hypothetical protein